MESMGSNSVWSLVEACRGVKSIGSKLIYKIKSLGVSPYPRLGEKRGRDTGLGLLYLTF